MADIEEKISDLLSRAVGYMGRIDTATRKDWEYLEFAQGQVLAALAELRKAATPNRNPTYGWHADDRA